METISKDLMKECLREIMAEEQAATKDSTITKPRNNNNNNSTKDADKESTVNLLQAVIESNDGMIKEELYNAVENDIITEEECEEAINFIYNGED